VQAQAEITIARPRDEVFAYVAHAERLPDYIADFTRVEQLTGGDPELGTEYRYKMERASAEGTLAWTEWTDGTRLAWSGPPVQAGPGSLQPSGSWDFTDDGSGGTHVTLGMAGEAGGMLKMFSSKLEGAMQRRTDRAVIRLKELLEAS
jgi:uncharacterized protein YndB with AHSA1/START domain